MKTVGGVEVKLRPVSAERLGQIRRRMIEQARARGEPVDPPEYEATTVTGEVEKHPHDETTLETDQDREAWGAHVAAVAALDRAIGIRMMDYCFIQGVVTDGPTPEWKRMQEWLGEETPEDPLELKLLYVKTGLLETEIDTAQAFAEIMQKTAAGNKVLQEEMASFLASFRDTTEGESTQ
jgi:hypothetical protein